MRANDHKLWNNDLLWVSIMVTAVVALLFMVSGIPGLSGSIYAG